MRACEVDPSRRVAAESVRRGAGRPKSRPSSPAGPSRRAVHSLPPEAGPVPGRRPGWTHGPPPPPRARAARRVRPGWPPVPWRVRGRPRRQRAGAGRSTRRWRVVAGFAPRPGPSRPGTAASTSAARSAPGALGGRGRGGLRRGGGRPRGGVGRPPGRPAHVVRAGDGHGGARRPGRRRRPPGPARGGGQPLCAGGLPALGAAAGRDLPRPAVAARRGPGQVAAGLGPDLGRPRCPPRRQPGSPGRRGRPDDRRPGPGGDGGTGQLGWRPVLLQPSSGRQPCSSPAAERRPRGDRAGRRPAGGSRPERCRRGRRAGRSRGRRSW